MGEGRGKGQMGEGEIVPSGLGRGEKKKREGRGEIVPSGLGSGEKKLFLLPSE